MTREEALKGAFLVYHVSLFAGHSYIFALDVLTLCRHDDRPSIRVLHGRHPRVHHAWQVRRLRRALAGHHVHSRCQRPLDTCGRDRHGRQAGVWFLLSCRPLNSNQAMYQHSYCDGYEGLGIQAHNISVVTDRLLDWSDHCDQSRRSETDHLDATGQPIWRPGT